MISLLDDDDREVSTTVHKRLVAMSYEVLPELERIANEEKMPAVQDHLSEVISKIRLNGMVHAFEEWATHQYWDLFEGVFLIAKYRYPDLERQSIINKIDQIKLDAWLEFHNKLSSLEKIDILNHVFFDRYKFRGDNESYFSPANSYINAIIERRRGIPISLSVLYSLVAQRLNLPVYGVNMPHHFILAYMDDSNQKEKYRYQERNKLNNPGTGEVLFYINPFDKGGIFSKSNIDNFLTRTNLKKDPTYYYPCDNVTIVKRMLRNLIFAYDRKQERLRMEELRTIYQALEPNQTDSTEV
jgi:regulator of sirC expression with transglutaminase-like and TPR domain